MTLDFVDMPGARPWPPRVSAFTKPFWDAMSEQDWISYHSRSMVFGEMAAQQWLLNKYGQK